MNSIDNRLNAHATTSPLVTNAGKHHDAVADADKTLFAAITFADTLSPVGGAVVIAAPSGLFTAGY